MKKDYWWAPLAGVAFVLVAIASFAIGGEPPEASKPAQEIADFYADNKSSVMVGAALVGVAGTLLIFFAGVLRRELRKAEGESGTLSLVAFAGAVILATGVAIDATLLFAMAEAADDVQPAQLQTLQALWDNDFMPMALGLQVFLLASGLSIVRHGALASWMGWVAIVIAVTAVTPAGFIAFMGGALWIVAASIMLALRGRGAAAAEPTAPPAVATPA
jgi:hypothetical protein